MSYMVYRGVSARAVAKPRPSARPRVALRCPRHFFRGVEVATLPLLRADNILSLDLEFWASDTVAGTTG